MPIVLHRAYIIFKTKAGISQPWDLAARVSTWVIFSLSLSLNLQQTLYFCFPSGTWFCHRQQWKLSIREQGGGKERQNKVTEVALQRFHQKRSDQTISPIFPRSWQADNLSHLVVWRCQGWGLGGSWGQCNQLHLHPWGLLTSTMTTAMRGVLWRQIF